jgi:hypothetical protein
MSEGIEFNIKEIITEETESCSSSSISSFHSEKIFSEYRDKIELIKRQTNYIEDEFIVEKLKQHEGNEINVIKEYMGIPLQKKQNPIASLNQEIYRQFREYTRCNKNSYR